MKRKSKKVDTVKASQPMLEPKTTLGWTTKLKNTIQPASRPGAKPGLTSAERLRLAQLLTTWKPSTSKTHKPVVQDHDFERLLIAVFGKGGGDDGEDRSAQLIALFFALAKADSKGADRFAQALGKILITCSERRRREIFEMIERGEKTERPDVADLLFDKVAGNLTTPEDLAKGLDYPEEAYASALRQAYRLFEAAGIPTPRQSKKDTDLEK